MNHKATKPASIDQTANAAGIMKKTPHKGEMSKKKGVPQSKLTKPPQGKKPSKGKKSLRYAKNTS